MTTGGPVRASELIGQLWPAVAYDLVCRLAMQIDPPAPKRGLDPWNPADLQKIDDNYPGLVRKAATNARVETPFPWFGRDEWKAICRVLVRGVDRTSKRHPAWPKDWMASYWRAKRGEW